MVSSVNDKVSLISLYTASIGYFSKMHWSKAWAEWNDHQCIMCICCLFSLHVTVRGMKGHDLWDRCVQGRTMGMKAIVLIDSGYGPHIFDHCWRGHYRQSPGHWKCFILVLDILHNCNSCSVIWPARCRCSYHKGNWLKKNFAIMGDICWYYWEGESH